MYVHKRTKLLTSKYSNQPSIYYLIDFYDPTEKRRFYICKLIFFCVCNKKKHRKEITNVLRDKETHKRRRDTYQLNRPAMKMSCVRAMPTNTDHRLLGRPRRRCRRGRAVAAAVVQICHSTVHFRWHQMASDWTVCRPQWHLPTSRRHWCNHSCHLQCWRQLCRPHCCCCRLRLPLQVCFPLLHFGTGGVETLWLSEKKNATKWLLWFIHYWFFFYVLSSEHQLKFMKNVTRL